MQTHRLSGNARYAAGGLRAVLLRTASTHVHVSARVSAGTACGYLRSTTMHLLPSHACLTVLNITLLRGLAVACTTTVAARRIVPIRRTARLESNRAPSLVLTASVAWSVLDGHVIVSA